ncbi:hypothetical protein L3Q67_00900 [Saccharothrix sp. AJ9571]|nr:hypothetical protein L3Q67_00900 [Saccharothrix sp. AJ9571]
MSTGDLTPDDWSPAPVDPDSDGWVGTPHDPRGPMIADAQSAVDDLVNLYRPPQQEAPDA